MNLKNKMAALLPKDIMTLLRKIGALSNASARGAFVVGGLVRDIMLGVKNLDLDIVIEGDAIEMGKTLASMLGGSLVVHRRFGTCSVVTGDSLKIDLATARKEIYEKPAALPTVEFSSLKNDLIRRDFTINAMAVSLNKDNFGQLVDFFGGESDLARGRIKVLHDGSFIDDPTRIFRAVRFEQRFDFSIEHHTEELIRAAVEKEMFNAVAPQRIRDELILVLKERSPLKALCRMEDLHEFRFMHPKIKLDKGTVKFYNSIDSIIRWYDGAYAKKRNVEKWLMYLAALLERLTCRETAAICDKYAFKRGETLRILSYKKHAGSIAGALGVRRPVSPSAVYRLLEPLSYEETLLIAARSDSRLARKRIRDFLARSNGMKVSIKGSDIKALGLKPGPGFKTILKKVLYKKIDGSLNTRKDELGYARELVKKI